jgi:hypothetical protein
VSGMGDAVREVENAHRALNVRTIEGIHFVKCSCGANPTPHIWVGAGHYGGVEADGWDVLRGVIAKQRADACRCQVVGESRDPYEPHIPAQPEWEQAEDCPVHPLSTLPTSDTT